MTDLSFPEKMFIKDNFDNTFIKYNETTDEVILDADLERHLRDIGVLNTESVGKGTSCIGGGDQ